MRFDRTTPRGFKFTVQVDDVDEGRVLLQVLESEPDGASSGTITVSSEDGMLVWHYPLKDGRPNLPMFWDAVQDVDVDEWVEEVGQSIDEYIDDQVETVEVLLADTLNEVLSQLEKRTLSVEDIPTAPAGPGDVWAEWIGESMLLFAWLPDPSLKFDPHSNEQIFMSKSFTGGDDW